MHGPGALEGGGAFRLSYPEPGLATAPQRSPPARPGDVVRGTWCLAGRAVIYPLFRTGPGMLDAGTCERTLERELRHKKEMTPDGTFLLLSKLGPDGK